MADFGSLYWFAARHGAGAYLDVEDSHSLSIPQPMPASLFWSVTVYDPEYSFRNPHQPGQGRTALLDTRGGPALPLERQLHLGKPTIGKSNQSSLACQQLTPLAKTARTDPIAPRQLDDEMGSDDADNHRISRRPTSIY